MSPATACKLDAGDLDNSPLSDHPDYKPSDEDQEMTTTEERLGTTIGDMGASPSDTGIGNKDTGHNPRNLVDAQDLTGPDTGVLALAIEIWALTSLALALTMAQIQEATATSDDNGLTLHMASRTLSDGYQRACLEVQGLVKQSLNLSTEDCTFVAEASTALCQWVKQYNQPSTALERVW